MNTGTQPLMVMPMDCNSAVLQVTARLSAAGYQVLKSFDLYSAVPVQRDCNCDPDSCACQMVILLVYAQEGPPVTLILDSNPPQTFIYLANSPSRSAHLSWGEKISLLFTDTLSMVPPITACAE